MSMSLKDDVGKAVKENCNSSPMTSIRVKSDFHERVFGKKYNIAFKIDEYHSGEWLKGILINYNNGNLDIETDDGYVVHIPYEGLRWLLPSKKE